MTDRIIARLVEVPAGWENRGDFSVSFDGMTLEVRFGEALDFGRHLELSFSFDWVRSFRFLSEAVYGEERDRLDAMDALLTELPVPDVKNPSSDYHGDRPEVSKSPPRLFRLFHYKAGLIEVIASDWCMK